METELLFKPRETKIFLPSRKEILIRESSGADDELLSSDSDDSLMLFLSNVIVRDLETNGKVMPEELLNWRTNDLEYTLFRWRILQYGYEMVFKHTCVNPECKNPEHTYGENLEKFDVDLKQALKNSEIYKNKSPEAIKLYSKNAKDEHFEFTISTGHTFRAKFLTKSLKDQYKDSMDSTAKINRNTMLLIRELEIKNGTTWRAMRHFKDVSSNVMNEVRKQVQLLDDQFVPMDYLICNGCGFKQAYNPTLQSDFYFPESTLPTPTR